MVKRRIPIFALTLFGIVATNLIIFSNVFTSFLVRDDLAHFYGIRMMYRPLFFLVLDLYSWIFPYGLPWCYLVLFLIQIITCTSVYFLLYKIRKDELFASLGALLFTAFMGNFEVVGWLAGTQYSMLIIFLSGFMVSHINRQYLFSCLCIFAALMTHEIAVTFPLLLTGYYVLVDKRKMDKQLLLENLTPYLFAFVYLVARQINLFNVPTLDIGDKYGVGWHIVKNELNLISSTFLPLFTTYRKATLLGGSLITLIDWMKAASIFILAFAFYYSWRKKLFLVNFFIIWVVLTTLPFSLFVNPPGARYINTASIGSVAIYAFIITWIIRNKRFRSLGIALFILLFSLNLLGSTISQKIIWEKKELRRTVLNGIRKAAPVINPDKTLCFIDFPAHKDEIFGLLNIYYGKHAYKLTAYNDDNAFFKQTFDPKVKYDFDYVFVYDCGNRSIRLIKSPASNPQ